MVPLLLLLVPAALVGTCFLLGSAFTGFVRAGSRGGGRGTRPRALAALLGACAAGCYAWGLLHVAGAVLETEDGGAGSSPPAPCRIPGREARAETFVDYAVTYVPLRFVCETADGGGYVGDSLPAYVNPVAFGFAPVALGSWGLAVAASRRRVVGVVEAAGGERQRR
ncbi:hypothetical protein [Streptomyces sp. NPDC048606]|uniref:hypothetical protein n=1 Tax=Streptomyces sp. NPDC048606 TaxID=3154726 RepID=UPI003428F4B1